MPRLELFHRLAEDDSAAARRLVRDAGLLEAVQLRNVEFDVHRDALAARGGARTPALWDGARLHEGTAAIGAALADAARGALRDGEPAGVLPPAPAAILDADGAARLGAFAGPLDVDLAALAGRGLRGRLRRLVRGKRWVYALAVSDEVLAAVAVVEAGWFGGGFAWAVDRASGAILWERSAAGLPGVHARVISRGGGVRARLASRGLAISVEREGDRWRLAASAGRALRLEAVLDAAAAPAPFALVAPVPRGGVRFTQKAAALRAAGRVVAGTRQLSLEGGSGGVDVTAGVLARETEWRWAFAPGRPGAAPLAFNLCEGFGLAPGEPGENAGFAGAPYRLPAVAFTVGGVTAGEPWRIASGGGEVELLFRPAAAHREARDLGLVRTRFTQVAGTFEGKLPGPGGGSVAVAGLPGVVEDHRARW